MCDVFERKPNLNDTYDKTDQGEDINEEHAAYRKPIQADEARMYSLEQMSALWHLYYNDSHVRRRLDLNDIETKDVRERLLKIEQWRDSFEIKYKAYQDKVAAKFYSDD